MDRYTSVYRTFEPDKMCSGLVHRLSIETTASNLNNDVPGTFFNMVQIIRFPGTFGINPVDNAVNKNRCNQYLPRMKGKFVRCY